MKRQLNAMLKPASSSSDQHDLSAQSQEWMEALSYPIFGLSPSYEFIFVNYAAEVFFERSRHLLLKSRLVDFFEEDSPIFGLLRRLSSHLQSVSDQEMTLLSPRLGKKMVTIHIAKPLRQDEADRGFIVSLQMRDMAHQLRGQSLSRGAAMSMSKMTSLLAHEIKNPLAGIKGAAQLIQLDGNEEQSDLSQLIVDEADRIADLLNRIESMAGTGRQSFALLNVHEVLNHVINVTLASSQRKVRIEREFDPSLPDITGDRALLIQAFLNLLKNACEACEDEADGGLVRIVTSYALNNISSSTAQASQAFLPLQIDVIDNGAGIDDSLRDILFEPFISNKPEGSGLGLAVVASAIADHGGAVSVQSQKGQTHFQIRLPLTLAQPHQEASS